MTMRVGSEAFILSGLDHVWTIERYRTAHAPPGSELDHLGHHQRSLADPRLEGAPDGGAQLFAQERLVGAQLGGERLEGGADLLIAAAEQLELLAGQTPAVEQWAGDDPPRVTLDQH